MPLPVYFAPLEGITDALFRRFHHERFPGITKYFIPFVSPTQNLRFTSRELAAIAPEANAGVPAVPQVLCKDAEQFLWAARELAQMGYGEVNLNLGCPSGTVTAKGKGAGMLADFCHLERFLDEIFSRTPLPVSIKTRIGVTSPAEFERLLELYTRYPICELTVHPRTRVQFYKGQPHREVFARALEQTALPLVYNGDLFLPEDCFALERSFPGTRAMMLGRGLLANPALARTLAGGPALAHAELRAFHDALLSAYTERYPGHVAVGRMRELARHFSCCLEGAHKPLKALRKAATLAAYEEAAARLFDTCALRENPGFTPDVS